MVTKARGSLVLIGGHEDIERRCTVLQELLDLAGREKGEIVICTAASQEQELMARRYRDVFRRLGAERLSILSLGDRSDAEDTVNQRLLTEAACLFFTGGDQLRIASLIGGTVLDELMHRRYAEGMVIAGTSAGASVMSDTMLAGGDGDDAPRMGMTALAPGFGFLRGVIIDQHFAQRGRVGRLLAALAQNPRMLGIGIDEDTGLVIKGNLCRVIGSQTVTILDSRRSPHSNVSDYKPQAPLAFIQVVMHVLPAGYGFRLDTREPLLPADISRLEQPDREEGAGNK